MRTQKLIGRAGEAAPPTPDRPQAAARSLLDGAINAYLRWKWCRDAEVALDTGTQFLRDHGAELSAEQRQDFEQGLAELLDIYGEHC